MKNDVIVPVLIAITMAAASHAAPVGETLKQRADSVELVNLRTRHSKTFQNSNGTRTWTTSQGSVHFRDGASAWQDIDVDIVPLPPGPFAYGMTRNSYHSFFAADVSNPIAAKFTTGKWSVSFGLVGGREGEVKLQGNTITYRDALPDADLRFTTHEDELREEIILHRQPATLQWEFELQLQGVRLETGAAGTLDLVDVETGKRVWFMPKPFMFDATDTRSEAVTKELVQRDGKTFLVVKADATWVAASERAYPITVDPTFSAVTPSADSYVTSLLPTTTKGTATFMRVAGATYTTENRCQTLIAWDMTGAPAPSTVDNSAASCAVSARCVSVTSSTAVTIDCYPVTSSWTEGAVTWNTKPTIGAKFASASVGANLTVYTWSWNGQNNIPNANGVFLDLPGTYAGTKNFDTKESANQKASLAITYTVGVDRTWDGGGGDNKWSSGANWVGDTAPAVIGEGLIFDGSTRLTPEVDIDHDVNQIVFNSGAGAFTISSSGGNLTLSGSIAQNSANPQTLNVPVSISSTRSIVTTSGSLDIEGAISGAGGLTKSGANTLILGGNNAQTGNTTVSAGTLTVKLGAMLSDSVAALAINGSGSTVNLSNVAQTVITLSGTGSGTLNLAPGHTLTVNPSAGNATFNGTITGAGALTKTGAGLSFLDGTFTATGNITLGDSAGILRFRQPALVLNQPISIGNNAPLEFFNSSGLQVINSVITGLGKINRSQTTGASGNTVFNSPDSDYSGGLQIRAGYVAFNANSTGLPTVTKGPAGTGTITLGNDPFPLGMYATNGSRTIGNPVLFEAVAGSTNLTIVGTDSLELAGTMTLNSVSGARSKVTDNNTANPTTISGTITGGNATGGFEKAGAGVLVLSAANDYQGPTVVSAGTLRVNGTVPADLSVAAGATLAGTGTITGPVTVASTGKISPGASAGTITLGGLVLSAGGTNIWELANNSTTPGDFDQIVINSDALILGGSSKLALSFIGSATTPNSSEPFWQSAHTWTIISLTGSASNPGDSNFSTIQNGTFAAGNFSTTVQSGNILLTFTPGAPVPAPRPIITSIAGAGTTSVTVFWTNTVATTNYVLQYTTNLTTQFWSNLAPVTAAGTTASQNDTPGSGTAQRYYRVLVQ